MQVERGKTVGEKLAVALLPVLLHRIQNTTQLLIGVRALLELSPGDQPRSSAGDLVAAGMDAHEQGWLLGLLGKSLGADLLLGRHEPRGLEQVLRLVRDGLRRRGRDLAWSPQRAPELAPIGGGPRTSEVCAALAALVWTAGEELSEARELQLVFEPGQGRFDLRGSAGGGAALEAVFAELDLALAGCTLELDGASWTLQMPRAWLELAL